MFCVLEFLLNTRLILRLLIILLYNMLTFYKQFLIQSRKLILMEWLYAVGTLVNALPTLCHIIITISIHEVGANSSILQ